MSYKQLKIPNHLAIIVDGNGRWAEARGMSRSDGHRAGAKNLNSLTKDIFSIGIKYLSVFVFSTENFKRSEEEVDNLMKLFVSNFEREFSKLKKENVKIVFSGRREKLPKRVIKMMDNLIKDTSLNDEYTLNICLNYGGQSEMVDAVKKISSEVKDGVININDIDEDYISKSLYRNLPPIDLLIRTSGEQRISNFMLWQMAYAEFIFPEVYFPDYNKEELELSLIEYSKRDRRYGGINYDNKNN